MRCKSLQVSTMHHACVFVRQAAEITTDALHCTWKTSQKVHLVPLVNTLQTLKKFVAY